MIKKEYWESYLDEIYQKFQADVDPLCMLDALSVSWRGGLPLPTWAHEILGRAAWEYLRNDDSVSFDKFLGLKATRGRDNQPLKRRRNKEFRKEVAYRVAEANRRYGFILPVVFWLLSRTGVDDKYLSLSRIEEIYKTEDHDYSWHWVGEIDKSLFVTCSDRGYFDLIFDSENELQELGLFDSAICSIQKMLKRGK